MKNYKIAVIILAAGEGKRMKSKNPKVLFKIANEPMILRSIRNIKSIDPDQIILVASPENASQIKKVVGENITFAIQRKPYGTADATSRGFKKLDDRVESILVANGDDSAFYKPITLKRVIKRHIETNSVQTLLTLKLPNPQGLGRVIRSNGKIVKIVEEKEATAKQKNIREVNAGLYVFNKKWLQENINKVKVSRTTQEKYLVDLVNIAAKNNEVVNNYQLKDRRQWQGVNTKEELKEAQEKFSKKIHIMGMAGAGASAIAGIADAYGYEVSGCDINPKSTYVKNLKIAIFKNHNFSHIHNISKLIVSPAILKFAPQNQELDEAKRQKVAIMTWQEFQGKWLQKDKFVISVAGAFGKSTTTAMIAQILIDANFDPTCEIGATVIAWGKNFRAGKSKYYVSEADEYNDNFLNYRSDIAVILNVAWDHPDFFKSQKSVLNSYRKFISRIKKFGYLAISNDQKLADLAKLVREDIKVVKIEDFNIKKLAIIGDFRKTNANATLTVAKILKIDVNRAKKSVQSFQGVGRRLEFRGEINGIKIYDDYAVQPFTVKTTSNALKEKFKNQKVLLVFEPHTFSRINVFFEKFVESLKKANVDSILITDVFAARETGDRQKLAKKLAQAVGKKAKFTGSILETAEYITKNLQSFDVILTMGAGDSYKLFDLINQKHLNHGN